MELFSSLTSRKIRSFDTDVKSVLFYSSRTCGTTKINTLMLQTVSYRYFRSIHNSRLRDVIFKIDLRDRLSRSQVKQKPRKANI